MNNIRFSCSKCGQHLSCEPCLLGKAIDCPACKQPITIVTENILKAFRLLELDSVALLDEARQAHRDQSKLWHPDQFPQDPRSQQTSGEKTRELNDALETITGYYTGKSNRPAPRPGPGPSPNPGSRPAPEVARPETAPARAPAERSGAAKANLVSPDRGERTRPWLVPALVGTGVLLILALLVGVGFTLFQRRGPALTDQSTIAQWTKANEWARRTYCRTILVEFSRDGVFAKHRVRFNEDDFYDGLESISRQQKPEDQERPLVELCTAMIEKASAPKPRPAEPN